MGGLRLSLQQELEGSEMDKVTVKTCDLLEVLEKNKEKHKGLFEKSWKGYRNKVINETERGLDIMKSGGAMFLGAAFIKPSDHTKDYECAIAMLKMALAADQTIIEISANDFRQFALDNWGWSEAFITSNTMYSQ